MVSPILAYDSADYANLTCSLQTPKHRNDPQPSRSQEKARDGEVLQATPFVLTGAVVVSGDFSGYNTVALRDYPKEKRRHDTLTEYSYSAAGHSIRRSQHVHPSDLNQNREPNIQQNVLHILLLLLGVVLGTLLGKPLALYITT
ncbi:hypothetical protein TSMEX_000824 [Taenia solium]